MIDARQLTKKYGEKTAVDGLDFVVKPGTVTGFLGPNGAGKSTTMRMIVGLDAPTSGACGPGRVLRAPVGRSKDTDRRRRREPAADQEPNVATTSCAWRTAARTRVAVVIPRRRPPLQRTSGRGAGRPRYRQGSSPDARRTPVCRALHGGARWTSRPRRW
ncbi:ATP-binding cassette domain-containing protein [Streptomyces bottropensis]|uniref:ATP-binding cassette domain-containing protein n=1 Tax=Streptomyces bottropensis TaxID=42235 RepID=UPI002FF09BE0